MHDNGRAEQGVAGDRGNRYWLPGREVSAVAAAAGLGRSASNTSLNLARLAAELLARDTALEGSFPRRLAMSRQELEAAVSQLSQDELTAFARWFEEYLADDWDRRIEADIQAGRLDEAGRRANAEFEAGRCTPL